MGRPSNNTVQALTDNGTNVYAGGSFTTVGGVGDVQISWTPGANREQTDWYEYWVEASGIEIRGTRHSTSGTRVTISTVVSGDVGGGLCAKVLSVRVNAGRVSPATGCLP